MDGLSIDINRLPIEGEGGLVELLSRITDPRSRRGIRYPPGSLLTLAVLAALCGMRSYQGIAEWAADLSKDFLRRLGCWCHRAPSEPTFRRFLQTIDADEVDKLVGEWLAAQAEVKAISLDGKTLRGSRDGDGRACHLLAAITHETGIVVAQEKVEEKSNEITGAKPLLEGLDLRGRCVTADAMHTQRELARFLVEEKEADYVFIAKDNQPTLREEIKSVDWESFPPSGPDMGQGPWTDRETRDPHQR